MSDTDHRYTDHRYLPARIYASGRRDPANYWQCRCGVLSRSWEAADRHTLDEHEVTG